MPNEYLIKYPQKKNTKFHKVKYSPFEENGAINHGSVDEPVYINIFFFLIRAVVLPPFG